MPKKKSSSESPPHEIDQYAKSFAQMIDRHLDALDWTKVELIKQMKIECGDKDIDLSYFSQWLKGRRNLSREYVNRLAVAIARGYALRRLQGPPVDSSKLHPDERIAELGWEHFDWLLSTLLNTAGFLLGKVAETENLNWQRIHSAENPIIRLAWVQCKDWSYRPTGEGEPKGHAIEITKLVCNLLGLTPQFVQCPSWNDLPETIRLRNADMVVPIMMGLPKRVVSYLFSHSLSDVPMSAVVNTKSWGDRPTDRVEIKTVQFSLAYVPGEVGEIARFLMRSSNEKAFQTIEEVIPWLRDDTAVIPRVFVSEKQTCARIVTEFQDEISELATKELADLKFQLCFAAHPREPEMIRAVNQAISVAKEATKALLPKEMTQLAEVGECTT